MKSLGVGKNHLFISVFWIFIILGLAGCYENLPPIADAGQAQKVSIGETVWLEGDASYDTDGRINSYQWHLSFIPDGSSAKLNEMESKQVSFVPDLAGVYIAELEVFDDQGSAGRDHVVITVNSIIDDNAQHDHPIDTATPPMPNKANQYVALVAKEIILVSSSDNPQVDSFNTVWDVIEQPAGAKVILSSLDNIDVKFRANTPGNYLLTKSSYLDNKTLYKESFSVQVVESIVSLQPFYFGMTGNPIFLNLDMALPLQLDGAIVSWEVVSMPDLASATFDYQDLYAAQFTADLEGDYEVGVVLTLKDGTVYEDSTSIKIMGSNSSGVDHNLVQGNCLSCHMKPVFHIPTTDECSACHTTAVWVPAVTVDHTQVIGACMDCHNNVVAAGKSSIHIPTTDACEVCHNTTRWMPVVTVDHSQFLGTCVECHNGVIAMGKIASHIATTDACETCHAYSQWVPTITVDHDQVLGACMDCHNNIVAAGKSPIHVPTTDRCESCHTPLSFMPVITVDHNEVLGQCDSCHNGIIASGKPVNHPQSSDSCSDCHNTQIWKPLKSDQTIAGLDITLESDRSVYKIGDLIKVKSTFTNNSAKETTLFLASPKSSPVMIQVSGNGLDPITLSNPNDPPVDLTVTDSLIVKPGETLVREVMWDQMMPAGGLVRAGDYLLDGFVTMINGDANSQLRYEMQISITVEPSINLVSEESALLAALKDPMVMSWYEANGSSIMCRVNHMIVLVDNYTLIPIETLLPAPESSIKCHTELVKTTGLEWLVYFHSDKALDKFSYKIVIDAISGEIKLAEAISVK